MNKPTLYLETTIPSYYTARLSQNLIAAAHQAITTEWWINESSKFDIYISQFVLDEAAEGDSEASQRRLDFLSPFPLLKTTDDVFSLTQILIQEALFPLKAIRDISHIAISAVHGVNYLLTWNCTHINNASIKENVKTICEHQGFQFPIICTPEELMEVEK